jgi:beta-lactamase regulating signal transducer with metallopeptidase domain
MTDLAAMLVPALATTLLQFLWQGTLVGLLAWLVLGLLRNARPQARYAVACAALLACVLLPAWHLLQAVAAAGGPTRLDATGATTAEIVVRARSGPAAARGPIPALPVAAQGWIVAAWACLALLLSLRLACGAWWIHRLCFGTRSHAEAGPWQACVDRLAPLLRISQPVSVRLVDARDSPMTAGWWRPVVLLPAAVLARVPSQLLEALIAHELAHIRRHDYLVNLLQGMVEALLFYHPVVWWLSHRIRVERELVADDIAARVLGDRRRLAVALSELDRLDLVAAPIPQVRCTQAARGGQLMSRIRRLVRPERRTIGGAIVLPLLGLAAAGIAFLAHARMAEAELSMPIAQVVSATAPSPSTAASPVAVPSPASTPSPADAPKPTPTPAPTPAPTGMSSTVASAQADPSNYAVVREGRDGFMMSGDLDDVGDIRAAQRSIDGDFVWFKRDGRAWVIRDADTLARVEAARRGTEASQAQMRTLEERMRPHSAQLEALGRQMESLHEGLQTETPEMRAAQASMDALARRTEALAERQQMLARQIRNGIDDDRRHDLEARMRALEMEQEALHAEMKQHEDVLHAAARRMESQHQPMEALAREMEVASRPMEDLGRQMEQIAPRIEREAMLAHAQILRTIDDAWRRGLATPAPGRH